jgi:fructose-1,6-bisphosphatase/inositol monophosphatase family enzyme
MCTTLQLRGYSFGMSPESLLKCLEGLEPDFVRASQMALRMQRGVQSYNKLQTGNPAVDIVTEADLATQESILKAMLTTPLIGCRLLAEEDTGSVQAFAAESDFYLALDPIDGTAVYAKGGEHFSTIVSLHDGDNFLYMFIYFPAWDWTLRIARGTYVAVGTAPKLPVLDESEKSIIYWSGSPERNLAKNVLLDLAANGLQFRRMSSFGKVVGSIELFATGKIAGVYYENMNVYDGCAEYAIASGRGQPLYSDRTSGRLHLSDIRVSQKGLYYPGHYLVLSNPLK